MRLPGYTAIIKDSANKFDEYNLLKEKHIGIAEDILILILKKKMSGFGGGNRAIRNYDVYFT